MEGEAPAAVHDVTQEAGVDWQGLCKALLLPRVIEEKMLHLLRQGRLSKWFSGYGKEAVAVGCAWALGPNDYILPTHRNLGVWTARGVPLKRLFCQLMGKAGGFTKGRDRTFHFGLPEHRIIGMISHMGAMLPVACGLGLAAQYKGDEAVALALVGEGASREGDFHEALNLAAVWKLPVIFVAENNQWAISTPANQQLAAANVADAAAGYGMPGEIVDGNDVLAVIRAVARAAEQARKGAGPTLIEAKTFRMRGHEEASGTRYVPAGLFEEWAGKDPVERFLAAAREQGGLADSQIAAIRHELEVDVEQAAEWALTQPQVESSAEAELADVHAQARPAPGGPEGPRRERRLVDAIHEALWQAMERDEHIVLLGQDIAEYGGVFKVTEGFVERFGRTRVKNTPVIESGVLGAALGMALEGLKPVVEIQYADFITCGFNQIVNNLATTRYRWGAQVNVTIRAPFGGNVGAGPFHSQSVEAWFCHVPGLKVAVPSTPEDAKGLLMAAIEDPNPVLFLEHKYLYRAVKGEVPEAPYEIELGKARLARAGTDLTVATYGIGVLWALEEAARQAQRGVSVEVIDLRTLIPWDKAAVLASLGKTGRLLVLHEARMTGGFGAEIAARVAEDGFGLLDAPVVRVAGEDIPVPFSANLEREVFSAQARLQAGIERVLAY